MKKVSRRVALRAGLLAAAGTAAVAVGETDRGQRWLHQVGLAEGPDLPPPDVAAPVERRTLRSAAMQREVNWRLYVPDAPVEALLLCLHGRNRDDRFAFDDIGVHRFVAAGKKPWAVAAVDGGASSYWHRRISGEDPQGMVLDELVPHVREEIGPVPLMLLGWSMGGYGALLAATQRSSAVAAVAASSPALWPSFRHAAPGAFDSREDFERNNVFDEVVRLRRMPVELACGDDDPFRAAVQSLASELPTCETNFGSGFHESSTWRSFIPAQLHFLQRSI